MVELHRTVFETINPGLPQTKAVAEAQIELAAAYVKGRRVDRDVEFGCGLALNARGSSQRLLEDGPLRVQWHFEGAPQFGSGTFGLLGGPENAP